MWNIFKEYRHYVFAVILTVLPLIALNAGDKKPADLFWYDKAVLRITSPMQNLLSWGIGSAWESIQNYFLLLETKKNNIVLTNENRKLLNELASFHEVVLENKRLRKLVGFSEAIPGKKVTAQIIAHDIFSEFRSIRLNKGSRHGVTKGMAVVTHEGIVGRVFRVDKNYSDVLTLLDSSSAIDSIIQRNRSRGIVEGLTQNLLSMKYIPRTENIHVDDIVLSSGIGALFPKGVPIGRVTKVKKKNYGITQTVEVFPSVNFSKLEEVTIIKPDLRAENIPSEEPKSVEQKKL